MRSATISPIIGRLELDDEDVIAIGERIAAAGIEAIDLIVGRAQAFGLSTDIRPENLIIRPTTG